MADETIHRPGPRWRSLISDQHTGGAVEFGDATDTELLRAVRQGGADAERARAMLTERYEPLVTGQSTGLLRGRRPDREGGVATARSGLRRAIEHFDIDHGAPFAVYAHAKIRGEMRRCSRDGRYSVNSPRRLCEQVTQPRMVQVRRAAAQLETDLHRQPDVVEVAARLGCTVGELLEALAVHSFERATRTERERATRTERARGVRGTNSDRVQDGRTLTPVPPRPLSWWSDWLARP